MDTRENKIDESAVQTVIAEMRAYRSDVSEETIRQTIRRYIIGGEPRGETAQDIWWGYLRALGQDK
jgi:hypothetical protein